MLRPKHSLLLSIKVILLLGTLALLFFPFPTTIARKTVICFIRSADTLRPGIKVYQSWETFGLWGGGRDECTSDASGTVEFPKRVAYGTVASRGLNRLFSIIAVHASYGASVRVDFELESPEKAVFTTPTLKPFEPFATSGSYLDSTGRYYFPQINGITQLVSITGNFLHATNRIIINIE